jgi:hypothetical protein
MITDCYLLDQPEYREGFIHRVVRCSPRTVERVVREGWTELGAGTTRDYRVIVSGGSLYEARFEREPEGALERTV